MNDINERVVKNEIELKLLAGKVDVVASKLENIDKKLDVLTSDINTMKLSLQKYVGMSIGIIFAVEVGMKLFLK